MNILEKIGKVRSVALIIGIIAVVLVSAWLGNGKPLAILGAGLVFLVIHKILDKLSERDIFMPLSAIFSLVFLLVAALMFLLAAGEGMKGLGII